MAEMRNRNIAANVHTYSALMNVCIKCGELELALEVFNQLQVGTSKCYDMYNTLHVCGSACRLHMYCRWT